mgnify:CR=1 FL=1
MVETEELSESAENYLKTIYRLMADENTYVKPKLLAEFLTYAPSTMTLTLQRLARKGYIEYIKYRGVRLTERGILRVAKILRAHRLCEVFLHQKLGLDLVLTHNEACRMEHVISEETVNRLEAFLNYPKFCPHGNPIPDKNLRLIKLNDIALSDVGVGVYRVSRIAFETPEILALMLHIGIKPDVVLKVLKIDKVNRVLMVKLGSSEHIIPLRVAQVIMVKRA